jgi:poly(3-hydroxybutyrate) depolymerase
MAFLSRVLLLASILDLTAAAAAAAAPGCGKQVANVGATTLVNLTSSDTTRNYFVHVPSGYDVNRQYPVVLAFHGSPETSQELELDTRLSDPKWSTGASCL